ncbi:hypothetical protein H9649_14160 [Sporosarcina sp. Sa2YVA2]|uniref:DUF4355 domain-containing protein n=1 Tax=Sporosarcina quadrami TaxID=2762234 RepID=A0ABR8UCH7_9BACL|nr:hypothetical protein [Sporosarcina quadrami]MBD7985731.1 hypothetical protein [Sporosarcina quadrami]
MKINPNHVTSHQKPVQPKAKQDDAKKNESVVQQNQQVDKYIPSEKEQSVTYEKPAFKPDVTTIERLKAESDQAFEQLRNLVRQLLKEQGMTFKDVLSGEKQLVVDEATRLDAQAAIEAGGEHSPEKVSDRLVEFANAISGGDRSKFELLKGAIEDGFAQAKAAMGGTLPEISQKTYDLTMEKLNNWKEEK